MVKIRIETLDAYSAVDSWLNNEEDGPVEFSETRPKFGTGWVLTGHCLAKHLPYVSIISDTDQLKSSDISYGDVVTISGEVTPHGIVTGEGSPGQINLIDQAATSGTCNV